MNSLLRHGRRSLELHKWCSLRFSAKLGQKASAISNSASSASTSYESPNENFSISNLIDFCRWVKKTYDWISNLEVEEDEEETADTISFSNLSRSHCHRVSRNITCYPRLLIAYDADKALVPKLEFLQFRGASSSMISFYNDFVIDFLRDEEEEADNISRDVFVLKALGVPLELLITMVNFNTLGDVNGKEKYKKAIKEVIDTGFGPTTLKIFQALRVFYVLGDKTEQEKSQC